jgi:hypothetical protein
VGNKAKHKEKEIKRINNKEDNKKIRRNKQQKI